MHLTVKYFGEIREQLGIAQQNIITKATTISRLLEELAEIFPQQIPLIVTVNNQIVPPQDYEIPGAFRGGDTIAIMPPFVGG